MPPAVEGGAPRAEPARANWRGLAAYATICNATPIDPQTSENMRSESLPNLGDIEREVMQLIWANGSLTAEFVRERLARRLKESTVRTVLRRLEEKGYVNHAVEGRTYVYQATHPRGKVAAKAVQRIVDLFCNGSVEEVLVGMVDSAMLDPRQLRTLADMVAKAKGGKR
jgi:BlaI family penicillinase repressor